ncbi:spinster family MFS transporter [Phenylobacterium sp. VNQ135]|uniref:spinster family MFS transporter n=1 Tax=Phenylobacterium sp. VNQ135 TaxID=3400922 RepID=UPI003C2BC57C
MVLLAVVNVFNFMDRTVISVLMPSIKADLGLNDTQLGFLSGLAFALFYATLGIPIAALADRSIRRNIIAVALVIWSSMTAICGTAQSFLHLLMCRVGVGVGEAGCLPSSHSLISDYVPPAKRSSALAIHTAGSTIGSMCGLMIGGLLVAQFGWRETFVILGLPGLLLAVVVWLTLREPPRGGADPKSALVAAAGEPTTILGLIRARPAYIHMVLVFGAGGFVSFGLQQWLPSFYVRSYGLTIGQVGLVYGAVSGLASTLGALLGGYIGDRLLKRGPLTAIAYAIICAILAFAFKIAMLLADQASISLTFNFFSSFFGLAAHGPCFALVQGVTPAHLRARAAAVLTLLTSLIGTGAGPLFIGFVSDLYGHVGAESLRYGLLWCSAIALWPVLHLMLARRTILQDLKA